MSQSPSHFSDHPHHSSHSHGRAPARRPRIPAKTASHPQQRGAAGYTLAHAGKQVRFGPVVFWIVVGTVTLLGIWSAATATYFAFRDDVLTRLIARQAEMQYSYEDRIAELRARIDRTTSHQLLDQEQFDQKLDQIIRRQAVLDSRTAALGALPETAATGSIKPAPRSLSDKLFGRGKPSPVSENGTPVGRPERHSRLGPRSSVDGRKSAYDRNVSLHLADLEASLDRVESRQNAMLNSAQRTFEARVQKMRGLFTDLGLDAATMEAAAPRAAMGGPYIPVKLTADAGSFEHQLHRVNLTRAQADRLSRALVQVPYRKPVLGEVEFTSGFGVRTDPFLGRPAMHTGLDFRASTGDPVRATAGGRVVSAGWAGGYGRMVEVDHGNGLSTRYGHLSEIHVKVGDHVQVGQVLGAVGSTGRSTGPHLHYETRIDGEAVDPQRFLRAGARYAAS